MLGQKNKEIPTEKIMTMQGQGLKNTDIISNLKNEGYSHEQISNALDQSAIKKELSGMEMPQHKQIPQNDNVPLALMNAPSPTQEPQIQQEISQSQQLPPQIQQEPVQQFNPEQTFAPQQEMVQEPLERSSYNAIEEIAESIIKEKWGDLIKGVGDIKAWKERVDVDLEGTKQELVRTHEKFENLQKAVMGKVSEYSEGVNNVGNEMKALEKVLEKIILPLTKSVKDLQEVSETLANKKTRKTTIKKNK